MNTPVYLGLSILELSKIIRYEFWKGNKETKKVGHKEET